MCHLEHNRCSMMFTEEMGGEGTSEKQWFSGQGQIIYVGVGRWVASKPAQTLFIIPTIPDIQGQVWLLIISHRVLQINFKWTGKWSLKNIKWVMAEDIVITEYFTFHWLLCFYIFLKFCLAYLNHNLLKRIVTFFTNYSLFATQQKIYLKTKKISKNKRMPPWSFQQIELSTSQD